MVIKAETIIEQSVLGIIAIDLHGNVQYVNRQAKQLLNCEIPLNSSLYSNEPEIADNVISCMEKGKDKYSFNNKRLKHKKQSLQPIAKPA